MALHFKTLSPGLCLLPLSGSAGALTMEGYVSRGEEPVGQAWGQDPGLTAPTQWETKNKVPEVKHDVQSSGIELNHTVWVLLFRSVLIQYSHLSLLLAASCSHLPDASSPH